MPTKPSTTYTFATDPTFDSGPASPLGVTRIIPPSLPQGFIPGTGIAPEYINYLFNVSGAWLTDWVAQGSNAADEDAHLVETDDEGQVSAVRAVFGGALDGGPQASVILTAPGATAGAGNACTVTNATKGGNNALSVLQSVAGSTEAAGLFRSDDGTGPALEASVFAGATGPAIRATHDLSDGSIPALDVSVNQGAGGVSPGIIVTTDSGYGIIVGTGGQRAPLRLDPNNTAPIVGLSGDVYYDDTDSRLRVRSDAAWRSLWHTTRGFVRAYAESLGETAFSAGGSPTAKASVNVPASDNLRAGAIVHVRCVCEVGSDNAATDDVQLGIFDSTAPADILALRDIRTFQASGAADEKYVVLEADYTIPGDGSRTFFLGYVGGGGAPQGYIARASIEVTGQYD